MREMKVQAIRESATTELMKRQGTSGKWDGMLSSSAISTSVSIFALSLIDAPSHAKAIEAGSQWLLSTMCADGSWGDSVESPSNMTATLLSYCALTHLGKTPTATREYLRSKFGGDSEELLVKGVLDYYGKDLTFSVPILMMCVLAGVVHDERPIPTFPFELATLPQRLFRFLNLPVVSYAIPALIAIGICQYKRQKRNILSPLRDRIAQRAMMRLQHLQPEDGGFLEAAPLTAFVSMCLAAAGLQNHPVTERSAHFLLDTQREDGSWPIDTNLSSWVTALAAKVLGKEHQQSQRIMDHIRANATREKHPFTGAEPGGWGWSDLSGSVPDGDDTSGALVALHALSGGHYVPEVGGGIQWLMGLQNNDGGMPTFCKGWGKLPFDRSSPDITSHAVLAMGLWLEQLPQELRGKTEKSIDRMLNWLEQNQSPEHGWIPLWFGDQDDPHEQAPVYGTATTIDYLMTTGLERARRLAEHHVDFLLKAQNADGGWGGNADVPSKVTYTARTLAALSHFPDVAAVAIDRGIDYLYRRLQEGTLYAKEPIGLYFSRLWYSEEMYNITFLLWSMKMIRRGENSNLNSNPNLNMNISYEQE